MTVTELAQLIARRTIERAQTQPDPIDYFARAIARVYRIQHGPAGDAEAELIRFGKEFGLLAPEMETEN